MRAPIGTRRPRRGARSMTVLTLPCLPVPLRGTRFSPPFLARLPACPLARLPACPLARLPACPLARLPACPLARRAVGSPVPAAGTASASGTVREPGLLAASVVGDRHWHWWRSLGAWTRPWAEPGKAHRAGMRPANLCPAGRWIGHLLAPAPAPRNSDGPIRQLRRGYMATVSK